MNAPAPLAEAEIDGLFAPLSSFRHVLLAVSGGPDSMALMGLAAGWRKRRGGPLLSVASVDHALRPGSRAEAALAVGEAERLGLPGAVLTRQGPAPASGLQEAARAARYDLLFGHALAIGADALVTAHHADDQAETVLMRLCRGSGPGGLAGMRRDTPRGAVTLVRPFLGVPRDRLAASLAAMGLPSMADPSNADPRFERVRLRQLAEQLSSLGLGRDRLLLLAERAARADAALDRAAEDALVRHRRAGEATRFGPGLFGEPQEILIRVLAKALARMGQAGPIRLERLEDLAVALVQARGRNAALGRTLGGALVRLDAAGELSLSEEGPRRTRL